MNKNLSLLKYCKECHARCCKTSNLIGSPILSHDEIKNIKDKNCLKEIEAPSREKFWIIKDEGTNRCHFLSENDECALQQNKPLDCLCYPVKAVWRGNEIIYILDINCPASEHLSNDFYEEALKIASKSIRRFKKETYNYWLENFVGWVKSTEREIK